MAEEYKEEYKFIVQNLPSWSNLKENELIFNHLPFGMSRKVYKVTTTDKSITPQAVILRKFVRHFIANSIPRENYLFRIMSSLHLGPQLIAADENFRLEEYIPSRMMRCDEIINKPVRRNFAIQLASIHRYVQTKFKDDDEKEYSWNFKNYFFL